MRGDGGGGEGTCQEGGGGGGGHGEKTLCGTPGVGSVAEGSGANEEGAPTPTNGGGCSANGGERGSATFGTPMIPPEDWSGVKSGILGCGDGVARGGDGVRDGPSKPRSVVVPASAAVASPAAS